MEINGCVIKQVDGLPMGGLLSAPLSCIDAMYREESGKNLRKHGNTYTIGCRFRDDSRYMIPGKLNEIQIEKFHRNLQKMYGKKLIIELEGYSYNQGDFLDYNIGRMRC